MIQSIATDCNCQSGTSISAEFEKSMEGYHDLVDHRRREIYKIKA